MGNENETNNMELREANKNSVVSVDRYSDEPKTATYPEKHVARAYPSTPQSDGGALRVRLSNHSAVHA